MMKKSIIAISALLALASTSCKNDSNTSTANAEQQTVETEAQPVAEPETPAVDTNALIQKLQNPDSTVTVTPTGLTYIILSEGEGTKPVPTSVANVRYTGYHLDGSVFDSSEQNIVSFPLNRVVPGFTEAITNMNAGSKGIFLLPPALGYGEMGTPGGPIGPNETLVFEIELVDFN